MKLLSSLLLMLSISSHTFSLDDSLDSPKKKPRKSQTQKIDELRREKLFLGKKVDELNLEKYKLTFKSSEKSEIIRGLQKKNDELTASTEILKKENEQLRENISGLQKVIRQNYAKTTELQINLDTVISENNQLLQENMRLQRALEELRNAQILEHYNNGNGIELSPIPVVDQAIEPDYSDEICSSGTHLHSSQERSLSPFVPTALFPAMNRVIPETQPIEEPRPIEPAASTGSHPDFGREMSQDIFEPAPVPQDDNVLEDAENHAVEAGPQMQLLSFQILRTPAASQVKKQSYKPKAKKTAKQNPLGAANSKATQKKLADFFESASKRRKTSEAPDDQENQ